jgi:asparagine synthase (glutamine-hydrolysing)
MCGICGVVRTNERTVDPELLEKMATSMAHRGPDDHGYWRSPDARVGFGHRRLSIIDLSPGGHQPMLDRGGNLCIVFNGEIYNFLELRAELEGLGHAFFTSSDTEVILAAYRQWGVDCVRKLNGMFAFALFDTQQRRLFMARDRAGEKPLFYRHEGGTFAFASELKALLADGEMRRTIDPEALNEFFAFGYVPGESSIFAGVRKLPQGSALTLDLASDSLRVWRYWTLPPPPNGQPRREEELLEEIEHLLMDSVRLRLIADVPVGVMLSGGVDSSLVTAMAARVSSQPVRTFTISFPGYGTFDESPHARIVAQHFGTQHVELAAEAATVDLLPELARQYDEPMADSSMIPTFLVSRLIRREAKVALGGDGGDELFGGYLHYEWVRRQALIRRVIPPVFRRAVAKMAEALPVGVRGRNYLVGAPQDIDYSIAHANLFFDVKSRRRLLAPAGLQITDRPEREKAGLGVAGSAVERAMAVDFRTYMVDDILVKVDRASMLASLEVRAPLLDPRIIEFAFGQVPLPLRAWHGQRKVLLRRLARKILPPELDIHRKQGFSIPLHRWFEGDWGRFMREVLREADPAIFDRGFIESVITGQERGLANTHRLFSLMIFELWRREYRASL